MIMRIVKSYNYDYGKEINNDNDDWKENNNGNYDWKEGNNDNDN